MFVSQLGAIPIDAAAALAEAQQIFISIFGSSASLDPAGTNGIFIQEIADLIIDNDSALTLLYSGLYNPQVAQGVFLDSICAFDQIQRQQATNSVVTCTCTGLATVTIPALSQVLNTNGDIFQNLDAAVIGGGGTVDVEFTALQSGPIACAANTVNRIVQQVPGWDSVNNTAGGVPGQLQQSDNSLRTSRLAQLAKNSTGTFNTLGSRLAAESSINDFWFVANPSSTGLSVTTGISPYSATFTLAANSVFLSVYGGSSETIGKILYESLSGGCGTQGGNTVVYTDPQFAFISNTYKYQVANPNRLEIDVTLPNSEDTYPANIIPQIQAAIYNCFYGLNNSPFPPVTFSQPIDTSLFYSALGAIGLYGVTSIQIGLWGNTLYNIFQLDITQIGTLAQSDIIVVFP